MLSIDQQSFSTHDMDNDRVPTNCAAQHGGFWYASCNGPSLNGAWGQLEWHRVDAPTLLPNSTAMLVRGW